jgi:hypothetical protein
MFKQYLRSYRRSINPPYSRKDIASVLTTLFILIAVPLTVFVSLNARSFRPKAAAPTSYTIPVLSLRYFPTSDGVNLNSSVTGITSTLVNIRSTVNKIRDGTISALDSGSIYHGYKDPTATPSLNYTIYEEKEFLAEIPKSTQYTPFPDHFKIFSDPSIGVSNICEYVENKGVKEVWIWMYHTSNIAPIESNMAGPYGDISNSYRQPDLPTCSKTYTVYEYNYGRDAAMAIEDHGHQIEAIFSYVDNTLWNKWINPINNPIPTVNHCGNVHYPPNGTTDYDWENPSNVYSNCEDWHPDGSGVVQTVNCHTWSGTTCTDDGGLKYKIWWMQNIPGLNNSLVYNGSNLKNWWDFFGDFDTAVASGKSLTTDVTSPTVSWSLSTAALNGTTVSGNVDLSANASDNAAVTKVEFYYTGTNQLINTSVAIPYSFSWNTTTVLNGTYNLYTKAYDGAKNSTTSSQITVTVSNSPGPSYVPENLSLGKSTSASSTDINEALPRNSAYAVDGNTITSGQVWSAATSNTGEWWEVDLGASHPINRINIYPSATNHHDWYSNFHVEVSTTGVFNGEQTTIITENDWDQTRTGDKYPVTYDFPVVTSRYVRVVSDISQSWTGLQEFQVFLIGGTAGKTGDLNADGKIDIFDLSILLTRWWTTDPTADLNKNGSVDIFDLSILLSHWGT